MMHSLSLTKKVKAWLLYPFFLPGLVRTAAFSTKRATVMKCLLTQPPAIIKLMTARNWGHCFIAECLGDWQRKAKIWRRQTQAIFLRKTKIKMRSVQLNVRHTIISIRHSHNGANLNHGFVAHIAVIHWLTISARINESATSPTHMKTTDKIYKSCHFPWGKCSSD